MRTVFKLFIAAMIGLGLGGAFVFMQNDAQAQTASTASVVQTVVVVGTSATEMPRTKGRDSFEIYNNGVGAIFCAPTSAGAVLNRARPLAEKGGTWGMDAKDYVRIWCIAAVAQSEDAATIVTELR